MKNRISVSTKDTIYLLDPADIMYFKCNNSTTTLFLKNAESVSVSKGMSAVEKLLENCGFKDSFIRPHQSYLVNRNHILLVDKTPRYFLVLSNQQKIPVSVRRRKAIMEIIKISN